MLNISITKIESIVHETIKEYAEKIFTEAMAGLANAPRIKATFRLDDLGVKNGVTIWSDEEIAAYIEFGTGDYAKQYLSGKPEEMVQEAMKFYVSGKGRLEASPYLFPAFYKYKETIPQEINRRIQEYFDKL